MYVIIDSTSFELYGPFTSHELAKEYLVKKIGSRKYTVNGDMIRVLTKVAPKTVGFALDLGNDCLNTFYIKPITPVEPTQRDQ